MIEIKLCLWNWADYNEGVASWEWFTLPQDIEEMNEWISTKISEGREEVFVCDSEHDFISESTSIAALVALSEEDESYISELSCYDSVYNMDDFDEILNGYTPIEIANMVRFGTYNPMHDYFTFDGYGNIETMSDIEYEDYQEEAFNEGAEEFLRSF